jgi:hypothetical protein
MNALPLQHVKPGDWLVFVAGLFTIGWLFATLWQGQAADRVIVRSGGKVVAEANLFKDQAIRVQGPLGTSLIKIQNRRVRVATDPSPRQYCVKQGWLTHAGEVAICLPNQVSVEVAGARKLYDSLNY